MPDSSSAWRFSSNQSRINPPSPEVKREDTMTNDPWSIWCPESSEETQVSVLPPNLSPQTSPPAELPRKGSLFSMLLESNDEGPLVMNLAGSPTDVPVDRKTGMNEAQKRRQRNAEASARSRKKRVRKEEEAEKLTEEIRKGKKEKDKGLRTVVQTRDEEIQTKDEVIKKKDEEIQTLKREIAKKLEDENKRLTTLPKEEAAPEEMSYAPDTTLLGATYDPIFNPFLTPDYYLTGDHYAADPTELYWDCIQSLYTQYE
ncbi:hypothetical protein E4U17_002415 [Claviceps sp. LM77 group G4]|nr:hypothetical protein E4U17_002415 [Claviceps sp. LM77 group G4]KAG6083179.1 hypothetical protein E4U16_004773 [Claviceps sp. LM84 group G4]